MAVRLCAVAVLCVSWSAAAARAQDVNPPRSTFGGCDGVVGKFHNGEGLPATWWNLNNAAFGTEISLKKAASTYKSVALGQKTVPYSDGETEIHVMTLHAGVKARTDIGFALTGNEESKGKGGSLATPPFEGIRLRNGSTLAPEKATARQTKFLGYPAFEVEVKYDVPAYLEKDLSGHEMIWDASSSYGHEFYVDISDDCHMVFALSVSAGTFYLSKLGESLHHPMFAELFQEGTSLFSTLMLTVEGREASASGTGVALPLEKFRALADSTKLTDIPPIWGLVVGGAALAALAAGIAAAYWRRRRASGDKNTKPPDGPVGYVLQLSNDRFTMQTGDMVALTATVWAVDYKGATSLASSAAITLSAPAGITVTPATGSGRVVAHLSATKDLAEGTHTLGVAAQAGGSTYNASVAITAGARYVYALELTPTTINLQRDGRETVRALVKVTGPDPAECERESQRLAPAIAFSLAGPVAGWFASSDHVEGGGKAAFLDLTIPENAAKLSGPPTATYTASVSTPNGNLSQSCTLTVTTADGFELAMDHRLRLTANDVAGSLLCCIVCKDQTIADADAIIKAATPRIAFTASGNQAHWLNENGGRAGVLVGEVSGGKSPGKEVHPQVDVPESELGEPPPLTAAITASVTLPKYGTFTQVASVEIAPPKWFVELQPVKDKLKAGIKDAAEFKVRVIPLEQTKLPAYTHDGVNALNQYLEFRIEGPAAEHALLGERDTDGEFRYLEVRLDDVPPGTPLGDYLDVVAEVTLCGVKTEQRFRINLSGKPELEVKEKNLSLVVEGPSATIHAKVKNGDEFTWGIRVETIELPAVEPDGAPDTPDGRNFTLSIRCDELPEGQFGFVNGALRLSAHATNPETQEEIETEPVDVKVKVGRVGLSISPTPVRLPLDPTSPPTVFKVRVVKFNETKQAFEAVPSAMTTLELGEWEDGDVSSGGNIFKGAGVTLTSTGRFEGTGADQAALWNAKAKLVIPAATAIDALRELTAPGDFGDQQDLFTTQHAFLAPADPAAAASEKIRVEQANCRKVLRFIPEGKEKARFAEVIEKDARALGADGLHHLRDQIWQAARESLEQDAASYLAWSKVADVAATSCDWVAYVCGLLVQGMSSIAVPFPADLLVNLLYNATPDFVNAMYNGEKAEDWIKQWANGFYEGLPGMGVDMALGMAINLEDMVKQGIKEFKDLRKACLVACLAYWEMRFFRWMAMPKPDGEQYSVKECICNALRDLAEEIITTGIGKNSKAFKEGLALPGATKWVSEYDATKGHGYDPKDGRVYQESAKAPDTSGMPAENLKAAQEIAKKNGVEIYVRPTNPASKKLLEQGALPKPEKIKAKTINKEDLKLGRREEDLGKVGYFDPGPEPPPQGKMGKEEYEAVVDRYKQRKQEFVDNQKDFTKLEHEHTVTKDGVEMTERVTVDEHGVVTNHTTTKGADGKAVTEKKCYTGDHDIYDIRGKNGEPLTGAAYDKVFKELQDSKFQAQHPGHRQWDYTKADKYPPPPAKDAGGKYQPQQSKFKKAKGIDEKIKDSHQSDPSSGKAGESLIKVGSNGDVSGVFHNPPKPTYTKPGRAGQAASSSAARDQRERKQP